MSWASDAIAALRKILVLEERMVTLSDDLKEIAKLTTDLDRRLIKLETKWEVYEKLSQKVPKRQLPES